MAEKLEPVGWLAEYLNTTPANAYYLISTGRIPGVVRLGPRMIRVDPGAVQAWIEAGGFVEASGLEVDDVVTESTSEAAAR
jgi:predicted DNA-binding transcriptional regulator AlpA